MNREEFLDQVAQLHFNWTQEVADQVPTEAADEKPTGDTDYPEHHHDVSATPAQERDFDAALQQLIAEFQRGES